MFTRKKDKFKFAWKEKAKERRVKIKALKNRLKELLKNRDHWKKKAKKTEVQVNELQKEFNELKKN